MHSTGSTSVGMASRVNNPTVFHIRIKTRNNPNMTVVFPISAYMESVIHYFGRGA